MKEAQRDLENSKDEPVVAEPEIDEDLEVLNEKTTTSKMDIQRSQWPQDMDDIEINTEGWD